MFFGHRTKDFYPLTLTNPIQNILFGTQTLGDRWYREEELSTALSQRWIEPTILPDAHLIKAINLLEKNEVLFQGEKVIAFYPGSMTPPSEQSINPLSRVKQNNKIEYRRPFRQIESLQYLLDNNDQQIIQDWEAGLEQGRFMRHLGFRNVHQHSSARVGQCLIDDSKGPVIISEEVTILPGARLMGPLILLPGSVVKMGAELYPGTTVGPHSTVNGEIKNAIIHEYTAKGHFGFLGDSILGRWNNLGAGTTTSNVSNTFSKVSIKPWDGGPLQSYPNIKRGLITGDFVKLGIYSKTGQGTAIGSFSSIAMDEFFEGNVPALSWWTREKRSEYMVDLLRQHCSQQMQLRNLDWTDEWEKALSSLIGMPSYDNNTAEL